ncbi:MAG: hypothetical protein RLZZ400_905, partial [Actinomycetota bacterium]
GVIAMLADKDAGGFFENLGDSFESIVITRSSSPRAMTPQELAAIATEHLPSTRIEIADDLATAVKLAEKLRTSEGAVVITGSISLVGDYLADLQKEND